jgi:type II secretory pathway pseudopilin PulG
VLGSTKSHSSGFTLVELNLSLLIIGVVVVSLLTVLTNFLVIVTRNNRLMDMTVDSQGLLRTAAEELRYGAGVRVSNTISDPNAPAGGWNTNNTSFVIIIAVPAEDTNDNYIIDTDTGSPYLNELVYFKDGSTLYKRILANPNAAGNSLKTTCPAASASSSCPPDRKLVDTAESMVFTLYDQDDAQTADPLLARSLKINLTLVKDTFGSPLSVNNSIRVTLRNTF